MDSDSENYGVLERHIMKVLLDSSSSSSSSSSDSSMNSKESSESGASSPSSSTESVVKNLVNDVVLTERKKLTAIPTALKGPFTPQKMCSDSRLLQKAQRLLQVAQTQSAPAIANPKPREFPITADMKIAFDKHMAQLDAAERGEFTESSALDFDEISDISSSIFFEPFIMSSLKSTIGGEMSDGKSDKANEKDNVVEKKNDREKDIEKKDEASKEAANEPTTALRTTFSRPWVNRNFKIRAAVPPKQALSSGENSRVEESLKRRHYPSRVTSIEESLKLIRLHNAVSLALKTSNTVLTTDDSCKSQRSSTDGTFSCSPIYADSEDAERRKLMEQEEEEEKEEEEYEAILIKKSIQNKIPKPFAEKSTFNLDAEPKRRFETVVRGIHLSEVDEKRFINTFPMPADTPFIHSAEVDCPLEVDDLVIGDDEVVGFNKILIAAASGCSALRSVLGDDVADIAKDYLNSIETSLGLAIGKLIVMRKESALESNGIDVSALQKSIIAAPILRTHNNGEKKVPTLLGDQDLEDLVENLEVKRALKTLKAKAPRKLGERLYNCDGPLPKRRKTEDSDSGTTIVSDLSSGSSATSSCSSSSSTTQSSSSGSTDSSDDGLAGARVMQKPVEKSTKKNFTYPETSGNCKYKKGDGKQKKMDSNDDIRDCLGGSMC